MQSFKFLLSVFVFVFSELALLGYGFHAPLLPTTTVHHPHQHPQRATKVKNLVKYRNPLMMTNTERDTYLLIGKLETGNWTTTSTTLPSSSFIDSTAPLTYEEAIVAIHKLKQNLAEYGESTKLFGILYGDKLKGIFLGSVWQSFGGSYVYSDIIEQAVSLLYFIIKDHPFVDGNKRIGVKLFVSTLEKHGLLGVEEHAAFYSAIPSIAAFIALSNPDDKDTVIHFVMEWLKIFIIRKQLS